MLTQLEDIVEVIEKVFENQEEIKSKRLKALVTFQSEEFTEGFGTKAMRKNKKTKVKIEESKKEQNSNSDEDEIRKGEAFQERKLLSDDNGILPDIRGHLAQFKKVITWKKVGKKNIPEPAKGVCKEFDTANEKVENIKASINTCLLNARKKLENPDLKFITKSLRYRFEFECKKEEVKDLPSEFILSSKSAKYQRFQSQELIDTVEKLEEAEEELREAISPFLTKLFRKFYKKQYLWSNFLA